ncbi:MAG: replicative DNA helicase [Actinomycetota bacterium]
MYDKTKAGSRVGAALREGPGQGKVPPHNLEAEESVLGACLLSREAIANVLEIVAAEDFYKPANTEIFKAMMELFRKGEPVDAVTLAEELTRRNAIDSVGGKPYIFTLVETVPTPGSAPYYARIVEELALLRRLIEAAHSISDMAFSVPEEVDETVDKAQHLIYEVSQRRRASDFTELRDLLAESMEMVEKLYEKGSSITGLPTGFTELDKITAGLQNSNLIIIAARPAMGKSSLALSIAQHAAVEEQIPVVMFSLEMSKAELTQRLICSEARVDSNRLRRGALQESDWPKISHALGKLAEAPIFIDDSGHVTIMEMRAKCRRLKAKHGLGLVIVDYLQLMQSTRYTDNRVQEVADISRSLKLLARDLDLPVIALSQLSRNVEHRTDKRPLLADLRDSGCLTADTRILRSDTGEQVTMGELFASAEQNVPIWTLDDDLKLRPGIMTHVFASGTKEVFKLTLRSGKCITASANHPFLSLDGWKRLDELVIGTRLATPSEIAARTLVLAHNGAGQHRAAHVLGDDDMHLASESDLLWDEVATITYAGAEQVYDATVPVTHNFVAEGIVTHNSIEQDSDVVMFIYRDEVYNNDSVNKGIAEIHISKHRNGPIGKVELAFLEHFTKFANLARSH